MSKETLQQSRRTRSQNKSRRFAPKTVPLPGRLYGERKRCNRLSCRCAAGGDALHGPYLFRRWVEQGQRRRQYVKAPDAERVRAGIAAWKRLHPPARSTRALLADLRRLTRELEA